MHQSPLKFDNFINAMQTNWSEAYQSLFLLFPRLEKISAHLDEYIVALMQSKGLIASDFHLLTAIRRSKNCSPFELMPSELGNYMIFSWGGITKTMNRLEAKGIISRVNCVNDKRVRMIRLTPEGEALIELSASELQQIHRNLLVGFTDAEVALLDKLLEKLLNNAESDLI